MVSFGDGSWRLAKSLITLYNQIDTKLPLRNKSGDGTIAGAAHHRENPNSDHEPDGNGVVRALDITHDPAHGVDTCRLAENLRIGRDRRIKYGISNRRIFGDEGYASRNGVSAWTWEHYGGPNPHDTHMHVSVNASNALADDTSAWGLGDSGDAVQIVLENAGSQSCLPNPPPAQSRRGTRRNRSVQSRPAARGRA